MEIDSLESISHKIRTLRGSARVSQKRLSEIVSMSQSTIARLETDINRLNPSYTTVFKVLESLSELNKSNGESQLMSKKAYQIMHRKLVSVKPTDTLAEAISVIKNYDFPQIPVLDADGTAAGTVYQKDLLEKTTLNPVDINKMLVKEIMKPALPRVDKETELLKLKPILENWNAVLVTERIKVVGIITIYDILKSV